MIKSRIALVALLICIMPAFVFMASAQDTTSAYAPDSPTDKGVISVDGNASYTNTSFKDFENNLSIMTVSPELYYFMWNNLAAGVIGNYTKYTQGKEVSSEYGIGPSMKMYFASNDEVIPYLSISWLYNKIELDNTDETSVSKNDDEIITTAFMLGGGVNFMIAKHVSLYPYIRYYVVNADDNIKPKPHTRFELGAGVGTFIF